MEIPPGPRKLRYFLNLLMLAVFLYAIGYILSQLYGFTLLENVISPFIENPMALFELAGVLSLIALAAIGRKYLSDF
ncbi:MULTISPECIES: hypothetical protein [Haloferax]|nr:MULTISPECIES: hypothetical protein [Haloferax]